MLSNKEILASAKQNLKGKLGEVILAIFVFVGVNFAISTIFMSFQFILELLKNVVEYSFLLKIGTEILGIFCSFLTVLCTAFLSLGLVKYFLNFIKQKESDILLIFQQYHLCAKAFCIKFLEGFYVFLWSLIPIFLCVLFFTIFADVALVSFIFFFSISFLVLNRQIAYSLDFFVLARNPQFSASQAIAESVRLTKNKKWQIVRLFFSTMLLPIFLNIVVIFSIIAMIIVFKNFSADSQMMIIGVSTLLLTFLVLLFFVSLFYSISLFLVSLTIFFNDISNSFSEEQFVENNPSNSTKDCEEPVETPNLETTVETSLQEEREMKKILQRNHEKW